MSMVLVTRCENRPDIAGRSDASVVDCSSCGAPCWIHASTPRVGAYYCHECMPSAVAKVEAQGGVSIPTMTAEMIDAAIGLMASDPKEEP